MRKLIVSVLLVLFLVSLIGITFAKDVHVKGYYRKDGTYVRPHIRSAPNQYKQDNYGPSKSSYELMNPKSRDYDKDGTPNYMDRDDDNDGVSDDLDRWQYNKNAPIFEETK
ncbi:MAG: hypothetical protein AB1401_00725 [Thermodesulfobacteriota bacterium]